MSNADGRVLGGRYELGDLLGYGGMAEVFRGRDLRLSRDVAVKVLRADLARDPSFLARFRREAQAAASLNHPSIVAVYDTGEDDLGAGVVPYIVMEYVAGRTLRAVLQQDGRLLPRRALEVTSAICAALEYSHRAGIVHRDVKPGNVMVTSAGEIKVMDFGIARAVTASQATMTQTSAVIGTAQYISPEQARGEHVDQRSDVYSTGCLLYELLTGTPPFRGDSPVAVAYQHVREDPAVPSSIDPDISAALDSIVLKAMAKNPANRYQSAAEFGADIDRAAAGRRVEATPVLANETTTVIAAAATTVLMAATPEERNRKRRAAYIGLAVGVLLVFVLTAFAAKSFFGSSGTQLSIPNVVDKTDAQAREILAGKGLKIGTVKETFSAKPRGIVIDQSPFGDAPGKTGDTVDLTESKGIENVQVPSVVGKSQPDATAALLAAKLRVGNVTQMDVNKPAGTVLSQNPAGNATVPANTAVDLVIASGKVQVQDVTGKTLDEATAILQGQGFQVVQKVATSDKPPNTVISQSPPGGTAVQAGSTITITVAAPPEPTASPTPTPSPTPSPSPAPTPTL